MTSSVAKKLYEPGYLAVYGSLKPGGPAWEDFLGYAAMTQREHLLGLFTDAGIDGTCTVAATLYDRGRYPGVRIGSGVTKVHLMHVASAETWRLIDEYEGWAPIGLPSEYQRVEIDVLAGDATLRAWIYEVVDSIDDEPVVGHGDWQQHVEQR